MLTSATTSYHPALLHPTNSHYVPLPAVDPNDLFGDLLKLDAGGMGIVYKVSVGSLVYSVGETYNYFLFALVPAPGG